MLARRARLREDPPDHAFHFTMKTRYWLGILLASRIWAAPLDVAPYALPLPDEAGLRWEDPREVHRVVVHFRQAPQNPAALRIEYWGSRWPGQHLPKDRQPGGGDVGWMELGCWFKYDWRVADAKAEVDGTTASFTFAPVNDREFPELKDYPAPFRYTLQFRVVSPDSPLPPIDHFEVFTDSEMVRRIARLAWENPTARELGVDAFNGRVIRTEKLDDRRWRMELEVAANPDPNTFDRTLITVTNGTDVFTFAVDDLADGAIYAPHLGVAVLADDDARDYAAVAEAQRAAGGESLYDRVSEMPEQTWENAWGGMPPKLTPIYFPLGLDGGRQRFRLHPDGGVDFRSNDHYLRDRPGRDTPRLGLESEGGHWSFGMPALPSQRTLIEESLPICVTHWERDGVRIGQTAFLTVLDGQGQEVPAPDDYAVFMARFTLTNTTSSPQEVLLPIDSNRGPLRLDEQGQIWQGNRIRAMWRAEGGAPMEERCGWRWRLDPGHSAEAVFRLSYLVLTEGREIEAMRKLEFDREARSVARYWRDRLDAGARLITPEPMLNEFYRSHAMHLLVNCEGEPGAERRFARVGSFNYGAYGNESCMMVVDLDRRGYHREAQECLDAWRHYQGTVGLPGDFSGAQGVYYGAGGYESGGYNQHHGWILWCFAEHYRFTRDDAWLRGSADSMVAAADWIIRETKRTADRHPLERGLLPAGSLEDIGDWWTWLSTSCYTWRGLDSAAWALEQIHHPDAGRIRRAAEAFHSALLANFRAAAARSPVVRLRDGTAVPHFPSQVHRRGRTFGWICETLEGALHLIITRAIDPESEEASWIIRDYEDNLYLSNQYGYLLDDFDRVLVRPGRHLDAGLPVAPD